MEERLSDELSVLSDPASGATSERLRPSSPRSSTRDPEKGGPLAPDARLSAIDYLLTIWQSDCAHLRQAGVELQVASVLVNGRPGVQLVMVGVVFDAESRRFRESATTPAQFNEAEAGYR